MTSPELRTKSLRLTPLAACLTLALSVSASSDPVFSAPRQAGVAAPNALPISQRVRRMGEGFLRIQQERLAHGRAKARDVPPRPAGSVAVTSCDDDGPGTLRDVVANAVDGDTVDLTALTCSTITLLTGGIAVNVDNLSVVGPGATALTIDANAGGTAFDHYGDAGYGTLSISGLTMTNGYFADVGGGGIWTGGGGSVVLTDSVVSNSSSIGKYASGGGIFSSGNVTLTNSTVSGNLADSSKYDGVGAGVYAGGSVTIVNSTISGNTARSNGSYSYEGTYYYGAGIGGGVAAAGAITISNSTISGNEASYGGGVAGPVSTINNSTITLNTVNDGNSSGSYGSEGGGVIVFNIGYTYGVDGVAGAGALLTLNSAIVFGNSGSGATYGADLGGPDVVVSGANNLVGSSTAPLPAGTLSTDPLLGPLANNGGPTLTHALGAGSPALNTGNNVAGLSTDQRGGAFVRVSGTAADIGSFEVQAAGGPDPTPAVAVPTMSTWALALLAGLLGLFGWRRGLVGAERRK